MEYDITDFHRRIPQGGLCDDTYELAHPEQQLETAEYVPSPRKDGTVIVRTFDGERYLYPFGQHLYDTEAERDAARKAYWDDRAATTRRNEMIRLLTAAFQERLASKTNAELEVDMQKYVRSGVRKRLASSQKER